MKIKILFILSILVIFASCEDILELNPTDSISSKNAIEDEDDLKKAILGCYDALQADGYYGRMILVVNEIGSDNAFNGGTILDFDQFQKNNVRQDNTYLQELWSAPYVAINRCNTTIYYANKLNNLDEDKKEEYLAEVYFLRALSYYNLTRLFKDVPLKLSPTFSDKDLNVPLSEQDAIYDQILEDLDQANGKIKNKNPLFASDLAVKTLLAKIYMEQQLYSDVIPLADYILTSDRKLIDGYRTLFTEESNTESIFEISFTELLTDKNRIAEYCFPRSLGGRYEIAPEDELMSSFEISDSVRNMFYGSIPYCHKYESITAGNDNFYVFRLAEVYLLRAEARTLLKGNTSLICNDINKIRNRVGLASIYSDSYEELEEIILKERRHEFAFEGQRRFDLIRTGKAGDVLGIPVDQYYYPIPISEINTNTEIN